MDEVMQELFYHILENTLERYYPCTAYEQWRGKRDAAGRTLWEQLPPAQKLLLEELQRSYDRTENCELEAMFLASYDQCASLLSGHAPQALI